MTFLVLPFFPFYHFPAYISIISVRVTSQAGNKLGLVPSGTSQEFLEHCVHYSFDMLSKTMAMGIEKALLCLLRNLDFVMFVFPFFKVW